MLNLIKNNYKFIILVILILVIIPVLPILIEIIFKLGNIVGTYIRVFGSSMCV